MDVLFSKTLAPLLEKQAVFAERRHQVLAANVAHINTPDYREQDLPVAKFEEAMRAAIAGRQGGGELPTVESLSELYASPPSPGDDRTSPGADGIGEFFTKDLFRAGDAAPSNVTFHDGNNRSIERSVMEMRKNLGKQRIAVELLAAQMNLLQAVISERP